MDSKENSQPTTSTQYQRAPAARSGNRRPVNSPSTRHLLEQKSSEDEDGPGKSGSRSQLDESEMKNDRPRTPILTGPVIELRGREVIFAIGVFFLVAIVVGLIVVLASGKSGETSEADGGTGKNNLTADILQCRKCKDQTAKYRNEAERYCIRPQCIKLGYNIHQNMIPAVDPCVDFWEYSCGGWLARIEIPSTLDEWGMDDEITMKVRMKVKRIMESPILRNETESAERKFKIFYTKCMDTRDMEESGVTPFLNMVNEFGGWAILTDWNLGEKSGLWKVQTALSMLHHSYNIDALFRHFIAKDDSDSSTNIIQFDQGGLTLSDKSDYLRDEKSSLIVAYKNYLIKIASLFNATKEEQKLFAESVFRVEKRLAQLHEDESSERSRDTYSKMTINDLISIAPRINWEAYLSDMYEGIDGQTEILIVNPDYFGNLSDLIRTSNESDLNNYFVWQLMHKFAAPLLTYDIFEAYTMFKEVMKNIPQLCDKPERRRQSHVRQAFCQKQTNDWFGNAVAAQFVQGNSAAMEEDIESMVDSIKAVFNKTLRNCWLNPDSIDEALEKIENIQTQIGFPKSVQNQTLLDEYYADLDIDESLSYFDNVQLVMNHKRKIRKKSLVEHDENDVWSINPTEVNAFYSYTDNTVGFSAGFLQPPYYDLNYTKYVSYATLGSTIAHEVIKGFNKAGYLYGKEEKRTVNQTRDNPVVRPECKEDFQTLIKNVQDGVDNFETLNEVVSEISGLKHAFRAFNWWKAHNTTERTERMIPLPGLNISNEKAFFISFAQKRCQARRNEKSANSAHKNVLHSSEQSVRKAVTQLEDFQRAFGCGKFSKLFQNIFNKYYTPINPH